MKEVFGDWQLGALHKIESRGCGERGAAVRERRDGRDSGLDGVLAGLSRSGRNSTARKGTAIITGDKLTAWDVENDSGEPAPVAKEVASGASDPMAISLEPFERQFLRFRRGDRERPQAAGRRRRRLPGAGNRGRGLPVVPHGREGRTLGSNEASRPGPRRLASPLLGQRRFRRIVIRAVSAHLLPHDPGLYAFALASRAASWRRDGQRGPSSARRCRSSRSGGWPRGPRRCRRGSTRRTG